MYDKVHLNCRLHSTGPTSEPLEYGVWEWPLPSIVNSRLKEPDVKSHFSLYERELWGGIVWVHYVKNWLHVPLIVDGQRQLVWRRCWMVQALHVARPELDWDTSDPEYYALRREFADEAW